jgi:F-type H+-transporting ATPase subunit a
MASDEQGRDEQERDAQERDELNRDEQDAAAERAAETQPAVAADAPAANSALEDELDVAAIVSDTDAATADAPVAAEPAAIPGAEISAAPAARSAPAGETIGAEAMEEVNTEIEEALVATSLATPGAAAPAKPGMTTRMTDSVKRNPSRWALWTTLVVLLIVGFFWPAVPQPHVVLGGEPVIPDGPGWITNSLLTTFIVDIILIILALLATARMKLIPSGVQNLVEAMVEYFWGLSEQIAGKAARNYFPWIMTIFLLVIVSNWSGIIPGVGSIGWEVKGDAHGGEEPAIEEPAGEETGARFEGQLAMANGSLILLAPESMAVEAPTAAEEGGSYFVPLFRAPSADLNMTLALALITMFMVQYFGVRALGPGYFRKFFTFSGKGYMRFINAFVGILELISEISRIISFSFRLYGNIFAGEIVLATMAFLGAFLLPMPFYALELFVGFVQALVFTMLALVFFSMSTQGHHDDSHAEAH